MQKKRVGLLSRFGVIFLVLIIVTLTISGVATYENQSRIFQEEEEKNLRAIADYLAVVLREEGDEFPMYQKYLLSHPNEPDIPMGFTLEDAVEAKQNFERLFAEAYPGKILGEDLQPEDMPEELRKALPAMNTISCCLKRRRKYSTLPIPTISSPRASIWL